MQPDPLAAAVRQCPFLARVGAAQGEQYARNLAANPFARATSGPLLLEEDSLSGFAATLRLFHGPGGVVPLRRFEAPAPAKPSGCPFHAAAAAAAPSAPAAAAPSQDACSSSPAARGLAASSPAVGCGLSAAQQPGQQPALARAPFASMSISGFGFVPDPGRFFSRPQRAKQQRKPSDPGRGSSSSSSSTGGIDGGTRHGATSGSSPGASSGGSSGSRSGGLRRSAGGAGGGKGFKHGKGWSRVLGGLIPLAANGHLTCPAPIVKMRAAVAALKPVRDLRPQALPIRALALGGTAIAANVPCGMAREHTQKFSPAWFLAVHATVPFVAMLRKAVLMPKWALALTLLGAIAGQQLGSRLERQRLCQQSSRRLQRAATTASGVSAQPGLEAGCRQCVQAAKSAIAWTLAPVVVP